MPLQNRCDPYGALHAVEFRGSVMGNRGGRIHDPETKELTKRRWSSKAWICCVTAFRGRQHDVWGNVYTAMFFLDEVTALAAGHRPCFECRNRDAKHFATLWANALGRNDRMRAGEMDEQLHRERFVSGGGSSPELNAKTIAELPNGTMISAEGVPHALRDGQLLAWAFTGYNKIISIRGIRANLITPPSIVRVLKNGYQPVWHESAGMELSTPR